MIIPFPNNNASGKPMKLTCPHCKQLDAITAPNACVGWFYTEHPNCWKGYWFHSDGRTSATRPDKPELVAATMLTNLAWALDILLLAACTSINLPDDQEPPDDQTGRAIKAARSVMKLARDQGIAPEAVNVKTND